MQGLRKAYNKIERQIKGRGGGVEVTVLTFYSYDLSSNSTGILFFLLYHNENTKMKK